MKSWRESDPAAADPDGAPLSLRHILGAPPAETWWDRHRNILWSLTGWFTSAAVVVSAGYLLWAMMFRQSTDADPFLGLPRPRATSTTAPPLDDSRDGAAAAADVVKVARPEPLSVATTATGVDAGSTTSPVGSGAGSDGGSNRGPGGPASPTTVTSGSGGTPPTTDDGGDDSGGNRGRGSGSSGSTTTTATTQAGISTTSSSATTSTTSSTSTAATDDDKGGGSGSGSGSGSGKGGSGKG